MQNQHKSTYMFKMEAILKCNFRFAISHLKIFSQAPWFLQAETWEILEGKLCLPLKSSLRAWISFLSCSLVSNCLLVSLLGSSTGITDLPFLHLDPSTFSHNKRPSSVIGFPCSNRSMTHSFIANQSSRLFYSMYFISFHSSSTSTPCFCLIFGPYLPFKLLQ